MTRVQEKILKRRRERAIEGRPIGSRAGIDRCFHETEVQLDVKSDVPSQVCEPCFGAVWTLVEEPGAGNVVVAVAVGYDRIDSGAVAVAAARDCAGVVVVQCLGEIENSATFDRASSSRVGPEGGSGERRLCPDESSTLGFD